tara:strand:- start:1542 stop:1646 length:105 start_codon:yes stop_codon:yes gene_type:complete
MIGNTNHALEQIRQLFDTAGEIDPTIEDNETRYV